MKIESSWYRIARRAGGLMVGVQVHFPASFADTMTFPTTHWRAIWVSVGLLFWRWTFQFQWGHHTKDDGC